MVELLSSGNSILKLYYPVITRTAVAVDNNVINNYLKFNDHSQNCNYMFVTVCVMRCIYFEVDSLVTSDEVVRAIKETPRIEI